MAMISDVLARKGSEVATVTLDTTVLDVANQMNERRIGALCVVSAGSLVGICTERDILTRVVSARRDPAATKVADVMTAAVVTCGSRGRTDDCVAFMSRQHIRHLPVVDDDKLVGLISTGDLMSLEVTEKSTTIDDLYRYLHGRT
jgi:CBS domain-containing protein